MRFFEEPIVETKSFEVEDIIAASDEEEEGLFAKIDNLLPWG